MSCEFIFIAFIIYYIIEEALEIRKWGMKYIGSVWNVLDMVVVIVSKIFETSIPFAFHFNTMGTNIIDAFPYAVVLDIIGMHWICYLL